MGEQRLKSTQIFYVHKPVMRYYYYDADGRPVL